MSVYCLHFAHPVNCTPPPTIVEPCLGGKDLKRDYIILGALVLEMLPLNMFSIQGRSILWRPMVEYLSIIGCNL